jgi:hypothetical protein
MLALSIMTRTTWKLLTAVIATSAAAWACGMSADSMGAFSDGSEKPGASGDADGGKLGGGSASPDLAPTDNAVILVHAASSQSFRLCFQNELDRQPQPDSKVMPEANVVGVEVGSAVRLGPLRGSPGKVFLFDEPLIRAFYPPFGGKGPTCESLLASEQMSKYAVDLGTVTTDLSRGVHLLVVTGCPANTPIRTRTAAECGEGFDGTKSNLKVTEMTLTGARRTSNTAIPAQVVHLSQALESARAGRRVKVTFGELSGGAKLSSVVDDPKLFGLPSPQEPVALPYATDDEGVYAKVGFRVELAGPDAGASSKVFDQPLSDVQRLSSPDDLPSTYFAAASNYVLLLLGDPAPTLTDGGPDDDERKNLHFLAVPVVEPKADAGADAAPETDAGDGGAK